VADARCRAISWTPIWDKNREGTGLEHLLYENLDGSGFRAELPVDEDDVVLDYRGVFRRIG